jgi:hypothetical protein
MAAMNITHRAKKSVQYNFWGSLVFWTILAIIFIPLIHVMKVNENAKCLQLPFQLFMVLFFIFWILYSLLAIVYCRRCYLHVTEDAVEKTGLFRHWHIYLDHVTETKWRPIGAHGGKIALWTSDTHCSISFRELPREQAQELILFFRHRLPKSIQKDWERFWETNWRTFEEQESLSEVEIASAKRKTRRLLFRFNFVGVILLGIGDYFAWRYTGEIKWLLQFPAAFLMLSILIYYFSKSLIPKTRGRISQTWPQPTKSFLVLNLFCLFGFMLASILLISTRICERNSASELIGILLVAMPFALPVIWSLSKQNKSLKKWNQNAAKQAAELYLKSSSELMT